MSRSWWVSERPAALARALALGVLVAASLGLPARLSAQATGSVQGIVTSASDEQPILGAVVTLEAGGVPVRTTLSDRNGLYLIGDVAPGTYTLRVEFVGYETFEETVTVPDGTTVTVRVRLTVSPLLLEGVEVQITLPRGSVLRDMGRQQITPREIRRVPTPAAVGDLVGYLQTLPSVVTTGDRGGQIFIRGGTHTENMTLMDGLMVYQPFHITGFFSVFPEDLISSVDFYAGGFGARYAGRTSSVMDVQMREGNLNEYSAAGSISPFLAELTVEGPISRGKRSWLFSARRSLIEEVSPKLLGEDQPLTFDSQFFKFASVGEAGTRCSVTAVRTSDRGRLDVAVDDSHIAWTNMAVGGRCTALHEGVLRFLDINGGYSAVRNAAIIRGSSELVSWSRQVHLDLSSTHLIGNSRLETGYRFRHEFMEYDLTELFGRKENDAAILGIGAYAELTAPIGEAITVVPGITGTLGEGGGLEPRFRGSWRFDGIGGELSGALAWYRQRTVGISDVRDASSVFVAWLPVPSDQAPEGVTHRSAIRSTHAQIGWQQRHGIGINWSVEGYYRKMRNVPVPLWSTVARFQTNLAPANGRVFGVDARIEYNGSRVYGFIGYGYSYTLYTSAQKQFNFWFGEPVQDYNPPHDRRHQGNAMLTVDLGRYTLSARWHIGSGLPFTQPIGFDEAFDYRQLIERVTVFPGITRMVVDKPYRGRLPAIHRLDVAIRRPFELSFGDIELQAGVINAYDRTNLFYYDLYTQRRVNQLSLVPYISVRTIVR